MKSYFNNRIYLAEYTPNIIILTLTLALFQVFLWLVATLLDSADLEKLADLRIGKSKNNGRNNRRQKWKICLCNFKIRNPKTMANDILEKVITGTTDKR